MTWLFSLYWLGALAVAAPILFHLRRLTPRGEQTFSTLMFLTPSPPRVTRRSRIEHWLLLLMRAASLILLALAFTRPLWRVPLADANPSPKERMLAIVVDTSASMRREGIWDNLIRQLDERISQLPAETIVGLFQFNDRFTPVIDFRDLSSLDPSAHREMVRDRLKQLKPTWFGTRLGEAMVRTATLLQEAQTERLEPVPQTIWLASDLQNGAETIALKGFEWPDELIVELIDVKPASPSNAGIQLVESGHNANDDILRIRVTNSADSMKEQFSVRWDKPDSTELSAYIPPGQSRVLIPPERPILDSPTSLILHGDESEFDNRVYVADPVPETRQVVYCGTEAVDDAGGARFFLERVFTASARFQIDIKNWRDADAQQLNPRRTLLVLVQPDAELEPLLQNHLRNGGTVLIVSPTAEMMQACLELCGRNDLAVTEAQVSRYAMMEEIRFEHPLFAPFAESQFSDFTGILFWKHRTIQAKEGSRSTSQIDSDQVIARFDDGIPAILELADRKIIVFAAGWQPTDSQFARSSKFPMLMTRLLELATDIQQRSATYYVGTPLDWPTNPKQDPMATGSAILPDGSQLKSLSLDQPFLQTDKPGLYELSIADQKEQFAVNLAPDESRTTPLTLDQLEALGLKFKPADHEGHRSRRQDQRRQLQLAELEQSQKLWRTILIAAFGLLLLETLVSGIMSIYRNRADRNQTVAT